MNNEILLGPINWFGGYNDKKCCENNFGFFKDIKTQKDEYIHKKMFEKKDLEKLLSLSKNDIKQIYIIKNKVNSAFILNDEYLSGQSDEDKYSILKLLIKNKNLIEIKNFEEHVDFFQVLSEIFLIPDYEKSIIEFLKEMYGEVISKIEKIYKKFDEKSIIEIKEILNETEKSKEIELFIFPKIFSVFKEYLKKANPNKEEILNLLFKFFDGTIIFQNEITNRQYDQIRIELIEENFGKNMQEIENFLNVQRYLDEKKNYEYYYYCKKSGVYYNRLYLKKETYQKETRDQKIVYSFKNGESYIGAIYYLMTLIQKMKEKQGVEAYNNTIINIPASNSTDNRKRYFDFLRTLCVLTGIKNGFSNLILNSENIIPRKKGGEGVKNSLIYNKVLTEHCLIFDDIVTEGKTIRSIESKIKQLNPKLKKMYKVAFQRTVGPYLKDGVEVEIEIDGVGGYSNKVEPTKIDKGLHEIDLILGQSLEEYCKTDEFKKRVVALIPYYNRNYDHINNYLITYSYLKGNEIIRKELDIDPRRYPKVYEIEIDDEIF